MWIAIKQWVYGHPRFMIIFFLIIGMINLICIIHAYIEDLRDWKQFEKWCEEQEEIKKQEEKLKQRKSDDN